MPTARWFRILPAAACLAGGLAGPAAWAGGDGLATDADRVPWARFQSRVVVAPAAPGWRADLAPFERTGLSAGRVGVLGDVYFGSAPPAASAVSGGFRATSGLILGSRSARRAAFGGSSSDTPNADRRLWSPAFDVPGYANEPAEGSGTVPYVGIGYSRLSAKSGWRFSADLGVMSLSPGGATGIGRVAAGSQSLDDLVRDMRLAPVVQLGVSYSF